MRVGIIDLGTNSVRFDVHQISPGGKVVTLHREKLMVRLGQGVFLDGKLDPDAFRRTLHAFSSFKTTCKELGTSKITAFATSALREASDSQRLINLIRKRTQIDLQIISGKDEARLIALGILAKEKNLPKGRIALIDIGGGSTEISICRGKNILKSESFALGTARLQQVFLKTIPPKSGIKELRQHIKSVLLSKMISEEWPKVDIVVGSSGTIRSLVKMSHKKGTKKGITHKDLKDIVKRMSSMSASQLLGLPGIEAKRVDMILAGAILFEECLQALNAKKAQTTEYSLRDGILEEELLSYRRQPAPKMSLSPEALFSRAKRLGANESHFKKVLDLCEKIYDQTESLHRLKRKWKIYLSAAAVLHDVGESVSPTLHSKHSYYIVKNLDLPSLEPWEVELIALLCLFHKGGKIEPKNVSFWREVEKRTALQKLTAILRLADALDRGHRGVVSLSKILISRKQVIFKVIAKSGCDLELLRVEQKKDLFEKLFKREVLIQAVNRV